MAVNKTKLIRGGEVGEVIGKKTFLKKLKVLFVQYKFLFIISFIAISICFVAILANINNNNQVTLGTQPDIQEVDQKSVDSALKQLQENPTSVPNGDFHPELGSDYFRTKPDENN